MTSKPESPPNLLRVGQAAAMLDIGRPQLQNLFPHLHILALPRGNRRFPLPYIENFRHHLDSTGRRASLEPVKEFALTDIARYAIANAEEELDAAVTAHSEAGYVRAHDAANILNAGRMSITDWAKRGELAAVYDESPRGIMRITEASLRALCQWEYPEGIRGQYWERDQTD